MMRRSGRFANPARVEDDSHGRLGLRWRTP